MTINRLPPTRTRFRGMLFAAVLTAAVLNCSSCSSSSGAPAASSPSSAAPSASPSPSPAVPEAAAFELLDQARQAAKTLKKYAFGLDLTQNLSGKGADNNSKVAVNMQGRAELGPLKLDQLVKSDVDGEVYSMRAILVPDGYYMYDTDFQEWSKTPKEQTADMAKTLSDFQVNPGKALEEVQALGSGLQAERSRDRAVIRYEGNGPEAKAFLENVLESTLDLSGMDPKVRQSIKLQNLKVELTLDSTEYWPLSYRIESLMSVDYEPGKPSTLAQTVSGTYSKHNTSDGVVVPEAAKNAPVLDPPIDDSEANATMG